MSEITNIQIEKIKGVVDVVFLIDATGSMQTCIDKVLENIDTFISVITTPDGNGGILIKDWRACVCAYRDYICDPPSGIDAFINNDFVSSVDELRAQLSTIKANGGGDEPESLLDGIYEVIVNRGCTERGAALDPSKWRARGEAARCVIIFSDATFHEEMQLIPGGTYQDIIPIIQQERFRLSIYAPQFSCYYDLSSADSIEYEDIEVEDGQNPVAALAAFTSDKAHFRKALEQLAKTVSQSAAADIKPLD